MIGDKAKSGGPPCPDCDATRSRILNSGTASGMRRRQRQCAACGRRWGTTGDGDREREVLIADHVHAPGRPPGLKAAPVLMWFES